MFGNLGDGVTFLFFPVSVVLMIGRKHKWAGGMAVVDISSIEELEEWMLFTPRTIAVAVSSRVALRVMPAVIRGVGIDIFNERVLLPIWGAMMLPWAFVKYSPHTNDLIYFASGASARTSINIVKESFPFAVYGIYTTIASMCSSAVVVGSSSAVSAVRYAVEAVATNDDAFWEALSLDVTFLTMGRQKGEDWEELASKLAGQKLWPDAMPDWAEESWHKISAYLETQGDNWHVWKKWYEARLHGQPTVKASAQKNEEVDLAIAKLSSEDWEKGPAHVNGIIAKLFEEAENEPLPVDGINSSQSSKTQMQKFAENFQTISLMVDSLIKANAAERENHQRTAKPNDSEKLEEWQALDRYFELTGNKLQKIQEELEQVEKEEDLEEASETTVSLLNEYRDEIIRQLGENKENTVRLILGTAGITGATAIFSLACIAPLAGFGAALTFYGAKDVLKNLKDRFLSKSE